MSPPVSLEDLRYFLLDMDGTVYLGGHSLPGAPEFVRYLHESGRKFLFFTNNSSTDAFHYHAKLVQLGFEAHPEEIWTAGQATAHYVASQTPCRRIFALGTPFFEDELRRAGLEVVQDRPDAVVLAFDKTLTYAKLEMACHWLRQGLPYWATNPDRVCPTETDPIPDCGAMAALIEAATGRVPEYIGKPNRGMAQTALARLGAEAEQTAMVGDRLYTDMAMASAAGLTGILVFTGETTSDMLAAAQTQPAYSYASVAELCEALRVADGKPGHSHRDLQAGPA